VNIKIAGKWMFIPLKMVLIGIDPYPTSSGMQIRLHQPSNFQTSAMKRTGILPRKELVDGFNPSEKYESQLGLIFPIYGKI
jgi:hypothetical protein